MSAWPKAVIFDLDGTLVDSAPDIAEAMNSAFAPLGVPAFGIEDVKMMIGGGSAVLIERAVKAAGLPFTPQTHADILQRFMGVYADVSALGRGLYPGAAEVLTQLRARGIKTALCTNKPAPVTSIAVPALGLTEQFDFVLGASDRIAKKPAADMLHVCCRALDVQPRDAVMVGDSGADNGAARAAGCKIVLVDFGYSKVPVASMGPDKIISRLMDLPAALDGLAARGT
jgi:phosphoglycolate phosphatase